MPVLQGYDAIENNIHCHANNISNAIDKNADNPKIVTVLNELGIKTLEMLTAPMPDWALELWQKFYS